MKTKNAVLRALWGFCAFIPFCWVWGVPGFTWFAMIGTVYFIPVHWVFDKILDRLEDIKKRELDDGE